MGMRLHVINGPRPSSSSAFPILYHCQHKLKGGAWQWGYTVSRYLSCIMVSITLTIWGGSWAGGTESVTWINRDWVSHEEIHQLKKCLKLPVSCSEFISVRIFLDHEVWDASFVLHRQWKIGTILSDEEAVIWDLVESLFCSLSWDPAMVPCLSL